MYRRDPESLAVFNAQKTPGIVMRPKNVKKMRLTTDRQIAAASAGPSGRSEFRIAKVPGLVLRVSEASKSWGVWIQDPVSKVRRFQTLGRYPALSLALATRHAREAQVGIFSAVSTRRLGPQFTFAELCEAYLQRHAYRKKKTAAEDRRKIEKDLLPRLGNHNVSEIQKADLVSLLDAIVDRGAGVAANRTLTLIRKIFNWAIAEGLTSENPARGIPSRVKEVSRDRILDDVELGMFWRALDESLGFNAATADVLRLQILLAARVGEVVGMHESELELDRQDPLWRLPRERSKTGFDIIRPLPPLAAAILRKRYRPGAFIFTCSPREQHLTVHAIARAVSRARERGVLPHGVRPHDLRRSAISRLAARGVPVEVLRKILGHSPAAQDTLARVYNRHNYRNEMASALAQLEQHILTLVGSDAAICNEDTT